MNEQLIIYLQDLVKDLDSELDHMRKEISALKEAMNAMIEMEHMIAEHVGLLSEPVKYYPSTAPETERARQVYRELSSVHPTIH